MLCVLPALLLTAYFTLGPTIEAFAKSLTNATKLGMNRVNWVGLENYEYMFKDKRFLMSLGNTLKLMAFVPPVMLAFSLLLAYTICQCRLKEKGLYRTVFFFPSVLSLTVVGIIWSFIFHPTMGIVNSALTALGLPDMCRAWLGDSRTALWCIAIALVWQGAGYYMVMHIAAMDSISA
ncbi:MAG: sugar ABC transporter permease [Clostridia bacterium]|nr:sugar ABC transporter permease [Clostridia bacterium]